MKEPQVTLFIDSSFADHAIIAIKIDSKRYEKTSPLGALKSQVVLPLIEKILHEYNLKLKDVKAIWVNTGPGSFTGLRVGIAIANALSTLLQIPVNGEPLGSIIKAQYEPSSFD